MGLQQFLPPTQLVLVFVARHYGYLSSWHWNPGLGALCGIGTPCSWDIPPEFLSTTCGYGTRPFHISTPPTSLDGCGFFNSVVVRLSFSSIYDGSEWWLLYISFVILMWLCKEVSCVYLCYHLDWKSSILFLMRKILLLILNIYFHSSSTLDMIF